jgi:hypothetical protein
MARISSVSHSRRRSAYQRHSLDGFAERRRRPRELIGHARPKPKRTDRTIVYCPMFLFFSSATTLLEISPGTNAACRPLSRR